MISTYELYGFAHVLAAVVWVGGAAVTQAYAIRATRTGDPNRIATFARNVEWVGTRVFMPASAVLLLFGLLAAHGGNWGFGSPWIGIGLAIWGVSFLVKRIVLISRVELALLLFTVFAMAVKLGQ